MREVAIVSPVRTPVGRFGGTLKDIPAEDLGALIIRELVSRSGVDPERVDEVVLGHGYPSGENPAIGRLCAMKADLPLHVTGYQLDRRCSSGLQAILNASMLVQTENADVVIAGGVESMSGVEYYTTKARWGGRMGSMTLHDRLVRSREASSPEERFGYIAGMIETAENVAKYYEISREQQDEYSLRSHQRAVAASESGKFKDEIVPVPVPQRRGPPVMFESDEGPRKDTSIETLGKLRPMMKGGSVTAGNSSSQNDAASVCLVVAVDKLDELGSGADGLPEGLGVGGGASGLHGGRARACSQQAICQDRIQVARHRPGRVERGICVPGTLGVASMAGPERRHRRDTERQRLRHIPRSPDSGHRRPDSRDDVA